jgi:hypothetical protein
MGWPRRGGGACSQMGKIFSICCSTGELLLHSLTAIITGIFYLLPRQMLNFTRLSILQNTNAALGRCLLVKQGGKKKNPVVFNLVTETYVMFC